MTDDRPTIFKFTGVSPEQLTKLNDVMHSELVREKSTYGEKLLSYGEYAAIKTTKWDPRHSTITIEVEIFEHQRWCNEPEREDRSFTFNNRRPTSRAVTLAIFDALERFPE